MGGLSISGLASGLDTKGLVDQLMMLERQPQRRLQARQSDIKKTIDAYKELNTRFKAVRDAADALKDAADWKVRKASSSDDKIVTAKVSGSPANGSISFAVTALSAAHSLISGSTVAGTDAVVADGSDFTINGTTFTSAEYGGGTLDEVVAAINGSDAGVSAAAVQVSPGQYRLQLSAGETGADGTFTVDGTGLTTAMGTFGIVTQGANATLTVGDGAGAYTVESATNTFTDVIPGLTFTAKSTGDATVTVENDAGALADKAAALVKALNDASKYVLDRQKYNAETKKAGDFLGSPMPTGLRNDMVNALIEQVDGSSLVGASVGIATTREGTITFDREKFLEAYAADSAAVEGFFTTNEVGDDADDGIAERLSLMAKAATTLNTGRIANAISGREAEERVMKDRVEAWDVRLELRETALRRQFTTLETSLSRLQSQGSWMAGQLANLPRY